MKRRTEDLGGRGDRSTYTETANPRMTPDRDHEGSAGVQPAFRLGPCYIVGLLSAGVTDEACPAKDPI